MSNSAQDSPATTPPSDTEKPTNKTTTPKLTGAALWVAIFALLTWIGFSIFLIARANVSEIEWTRITWVFGSIQAIAFAAAGALFGTAVQQQHTDNAQQQAKASQQEADQQREAAEKGRVLALTTQLDGVRQPASSGTEGVQRAGLSSAVGTGSANDLAQRHAQLSRALFGDLI